MRKRTIILGAIAALAAMAMPSAASAKAHLLKLYKVEKHVDLTGQDDVYTVSCNGTDLALDGMWRIDNVDQDNDFVYAPFPTGSPRFDVQRSVRPVEARPTSDSDYEFAFTPTSGGDVQIKLWVTCLGRQTSPNGHFVTWSISNQATFSADDAGNQDVTSSSCPTGYIVVQPGFQVTQGDADLVTSRPSTKADSAWQWRWDYVAGSPFQADLFRSCLDLRSGPSNQAPPAQHHHRIVKHFRSNDPNLPWSGTAVSSPATVKKNSISEVTLHCGDLYKGMVGGWDHGFGSPGYGKLWYMGMDPRIKSRSFKWINIDPVNDYRANLYLVCFKDKTT